MLRVNPYLYYQLAEGLKPVADLEDTVSLGEAYVNLIIAKIWVEAFLKSRVSYP